MKWISLLSAPMLLLAAADAFAIDAANIFQASKDSVVLISTTDSTGRPMSIGSGFAVGDGDRIVTNLHVIEGASRVFVKLLDGESIEVMQFAGVDQKLDLAILVFSKQIQSLLLASKKPDIGDEIVAIGNPQGLEATLSTGIVSGIRSDADALYYQITAPISPGSSGGPIIASDGTVIGIASFYVAGGQNLNFAVPALYIQRLLTNETISAVATLRRTQVAKRPADIQSKVSVIDLEIRPADPMSKAVADFQNILEGYVQNLSSHPIQEVRLAINYYKGDNGVQENNRGYEMCRVFGARGILYSGIQARVNFPNHQSNGQIVRPGNAEPFVCPLRKMRKGLSVTAQIIDYEFVQP